MSETPAKRRVRSPLEASSDRQRMWNCIVQLRRFSLDDLVATAEVTKQHASKYVCKLERAEYVRKTKAARGPAGNASYQLLRDTGPHAPRFGEDGRVQDPNLDSKALPPEKRPVSVPRDEYERALRCVRACAGMQDPEAEVAQLRNLAGASV